MYSSYTMPPILQSRWPNFNTLWNMRPSKHTCFISVPRQSRIFLKCILFVLLSLLLRQFLLCHLNYDVRDPHPVCPFSRCIFTFVTMILDDLSFLLFIIGYVCNRAFSSIRRTNQLLRCAIIPIYVDV